MGRLQSAGLEIARDCSYGWLESAGLQGMGGWQCVLARSRSGRGRRIRLYPDWFDATGRNLCFVGLSIYWLVWFVRGTCLLNIWAFWCVMEACGPMGADECVTHASRMRDGCMCMHTDAYGCIWMHIRDCVWMLIWRLILNGGPNIFKKEYIWYLEVNIKWIRYKMTYLWNNIDYLIYI